LSRSSDFNTFDRVHGLNDFELDVFEIAGFPAGGQQGRAGPNFDCSASFAILAILHPGGHCLGSACGAVLCEVCHGCGSLAGKPAQSRIKRIING